MPSTWFGKKDDPTGESRSDEGSRPSSELSALTDRLDQLGGLLGDTSRRIVEYLIERDAQPSGQPETVSAGSAFSENDAKALRDTLSAIGERLARLEAGQGDFAGFAQQLNGNLDAAFSRFAEMLAQQPVTPNVEEPLIPEPPTEPPSVGGPIWEAAILGSTLAENPQLAFHRQQLIDGLLEGNPSARAFSGELLAFQSAPPERLAQLLRDVGEAFYRWQPKYHADPNPFEEALADWLRRTCDSQGIGNAIELVHPGERFDAARHNALGRGVEITEVHGWIVLRDNGRVYTKATVSVR